VCTPTSVRSIYVERERETERDSKTQKRLQPPEENKTAKPRGEERQQLSANPRGEEKQPDCKTQKRRETAKPRGEEALFLKKRSHSCADVNTLTRIHEHTYTQILDFFQSCSRTPTLWLAHSVERWGAGVETQKNVRGEIGGWGRVPFNETYAPSLSTIYDGA